MPVQIQISNIISNNIYLEPKALHSELLAELSGRFSSRNEYFRISEVRKLPRKKFGN